MIIAGVDPGLTGAVALMDGLTGGLTRVIDAPRLKKGKGLGELDAGALAGIFREWRPYLVVLERQQAMPGQGVSSSFKNGMGYGTYRGILVGLDLKLAVVSAQVWQKEMFQGAAGEGKERSIYVAKDLFPHVTWLKSKHGRSDAALIAEYGRRRLK